jgi:hypothetical protein
MMVMHLQESERCAVHYNNIYITRAECDWDVAALEDNYWGAMCAIRVITTHRNLHKSFRVKIWDGGGTGYYRVPVELKLREFLSELQVLLRWIAIEDKVEVKILSRNGKLNQKLQGRRYTEANWYWLHKEYKGKTNCSSFQSIYTSLLTNEIILKELNKKRKIKINFTGGTNQIGKERKG